MKKHFEIMKTRLMGLVFVEFVFSVIFSVFFEKNLSFILFVMMSLNALIIFIIYQRMMKTYRQRVFSVSKVLGNEAKTAFEFGRIGIITFDEKGQITWMSNLLDDYLPDGIGDPLLKRLPEIRPLMKDLNAELKINLRDARFLVSAYGEKQILFFKDISDVEALYEQNKNNQVVLGIAHLDNYEETTQYEEEQTIAFIDSNIRQAVVRWANEHEMFIRRIRADRYLLVLNEHVFEEIENKKFDILHEIRESAHKIDANITLSLAFARHADSLQELEDLSNKALEMAQSRGGDQVAINSKQEGMRYYGGSTEAVEKRSKVRVRVMAEHLARFIKEADKVIIVGHKMMDFDSFASALGISSIASVYAKRAYIVVDKSDTEQTLKDAMEKYWEELSSKHAMIDVDEAHKLYTDKTLVIMTDHHNLAQTQHESLIEKAKNIAVIDHHRRTDAFEFKPVLSYIESAASSASELVIELFPYHPRNVIISKLDATFMYTGILIDTNRFRNRSHSRTFEAAAELRKYGADLSVVENMLRDEYEDFELKNKVLNTSQLFEEQYVIAPYKDQELPRPLMSQVADEIISVRDIEASFVVANVSEDTVAVSARSNGDLNVQVVMERLGGGGHFTGAAAQIKGRSINDVVEQIKEAIIEVREENKR